MLFDVAQSSFARVYSLIVALVILGVSARYLGPDGRGTFAAITTWVILFSTFGYLSLGQVVLHRATVARDTNWYGSTLSNLFLITICATALGWLTAAGCYAIAAEKSFGNISLPLLILGFATLPFLIWEHYGSALLIAIGKLGTYNRAQMYGKTFNLVAMLAAFSVDASVQSLLFVTLLSQAIIAVSGITQLLRFIEFKFEPDRLGIASLLSDGAKLHLNAIGMFLVSSVNVLIINSYQGAIATGHFHLATQLMGIMLVIPQAVSVAIYSKMSKSSAQAVWPYHRKILILTVISMVVTAALAFAIAPVVIPLIAGPSFSPTIQIFQTLLFSMVGMTLAIAMAPQVIGRGHFWQSSAITVSLGCINLSLNFLLIPIYGIEGAAVSTVFTYLASTAVHLFYFRMYDRLSEMDRKVGE